MSAVHGRDTATVELNEKRPILRVRSLSKRYSLYSSPGHRLAKLVFGRLLKESLTYSALEDVNFELMPGEALAVIGRNGAGKSTLLQLLSGVLLPTTGSIEVSGRVAGLLELGSGFSPEFSGRENIFINGAILGLNEHQTRDRLDDIIAFAEIGDYIDQPVKTYSSGMFLRLAFSVAIHSDPNLLLVDEALTVGDVFFQQKCYKRLNELRARGMTVLLVTHSMADAAQFCNRGIVLSHGRIVFEGLAKESVEYYFHHEYETPTGQYRNSSQAEAHLPAPHAGQNLTANDAFNPFDLHSEEAVDLLSCKQVGTASVRARRLLITGRDDKPRRVFQQGEWVKVHVDFSIDEFLSVPVAGVQLINAKGVLVHGRNSLQFESAPPFGAHAGTRLHCIHEIKLDVDVGEYTLETGLADLPHELFKRRHVYSPLDIAPQLRLLCHVIGMAAISVIYRHEGSPCLFSHYGVADLPSQQQITLLSPVDTHHEGSIR
ncbi:MAG: ABC transporter ATP-binding protein [Nitrospira sp. LK70]|nr:ABC transporter ATP-binding protein [Nitrospira sp. LK70]